MAKSISLPEDVYIALKKRKKKNESFAQVIQRLLGEEFINTKQKEELLSFVGVFAEDDDWDEIEKQLYHNRLNKRKPIMLNENEEE